MNRTFSFEKIIAVIQILLGFLLVFLSIYSVYTVAIQAVEYFGLTWNEISFYKLFKRNSIIFILGVIAIFGGSYLIKNHLKGWMLSLVFFISIGIITVIRFIQLICEGLNDEDRLGVFFISVFILMSFLIPLYLTKRQFLLKYSPKRNDRIFIMASTVFFVVIQLILIFES